MYKTITFYFLTIFFFLTFFSSGFVDSQDGFQYLAIARRIVYDQTLEMPVESFEDDKNLHMSIAKGVNNKRYSPTGLGYTFSLIPAVLIEYLFLTLAGIKNITAFPLENDWPVLLFASMTNAFWGALYTVGIFLYLKRFKLDTRRAIILSFLLTVSTNIWVYTKHTFAHMMFLTSMIYAFLFVKRYSDNYKRIELFYLGLSAGVLLLSYNPTYLLILPNLVFYYILLTFKLFEIKKTPFTFISKHFTNLVVILSGFFPLFCIYYYLNHIRFGSGSMSGYGSIGDTLPNFPPMYVVVEGIWGLLLSPGKSIFLYSPIILTLLIFWFKIKQNINRFKPELVICFSIFFIYLWFMGTLLGNVDYLVWHGESSWGPRYMLPTLPFFSIIIAILYGYLNKNEKLFVFFPLIVLGIYVNFLGIVLPYQIRFAGLQTDAFINGRNFNVYEYGNEIPRYAPIFKQSKTFIKRILGLNDLYNHGDYNLKLIDGFDYPYDIGWMIWRSKKDSSFISFDNLAKSDIKKMSFQFRNHQISPISSFSAELVFLLNGREIKSEMIKIDEEKNTDLILSEVDLKDKNNIIEIKSSYINNIKPVTKKEQVLFLQIIRINDLVQNIATIDYPYVSDFSQSFFEMDYYYWGEKEKNPWEIWHMHSGVYEQTFDFWWLRPLHYWDMPKDLFIILFIINITGFGYFGVSLIRNLNENN